MTRKEIFYTLLYDFLKDEEFELNKNSVVKIENGDQFVISFTIWPDFGQVEPGYEIFLHQVEKVKKAAWGKSYKRFPSVGNVRYIVSGRDLNSCELVTATAESALSSAIAEIDFYKKYVKPYFQSNSDIVYLDKVLNAIPGSNLDICFNAVQSSFLALIVGFLCKRKNMQELFEVYKPIVERSNKAYLMEFDLLAKFISN